MSLSAGHRFGPYEIVAPIGAGGMGEVYRAKDTRLDRTVAIKVLPQHLAANPEFRQRLEREARVISSLNHPHICVLHDIGRQDGIDFLVMEYLEGETLAARLVKGALPTEALLEYAGQMAQALAAAHRQTVYHRDLKPGNVMLTKTGAKLLDFGLAKVGPAAGPQGAGVNLSVLPTQALDLTQKGTILGTFQYMSPEQLQGKEADARSDIFAFGAVLYEMATGHKAFEGKSVASVIAAILDSEPTPIATLQPASPPLLDQLVRKCLEKDPEKRWQSALDVASALGWAGEGAKGRPGDEASGRSKRWGWMVAAVLAVGMVLLAVVHFREAPPQELGGRFEVPPPEKSNNPIFRLSPDGRYLAVAANQGSRSRLWVRPLDSLETRALPGTEDATYPFWSPDSLFLGFFAQGKLKKISVGAPSGPGPPQTLCDAASGRGGAWNREGVIVFSPSPASGLYRVPAAGGVPAPVTKPGSAGSHRFPEFLPDGRRFLFLDTSNTPESTGLYAGSLDGMAPARILAEVSNAAYAPPGGSRRSGHLLFRQENTLMAQPFDPDRLQTTGEMFPLAEQVGRSGHAGHGAFSVAGSGVLAYRTGAGFLGDRELVWLDRTGKRLGVLTKPGPTYMAALSPDEKRIALFIRGVQPGASSDVWLHDVARGALSRFTLGPGSSGFPVWSPDSSRIAFYRSNSAGGGFELYQKPASGAGKEERLARAGVNAFPWDWSGDGKLLVYSQYADKTGTDLWLLPLEGDRRPIPYLQTAFEETAGQFSPGPGGAPEGAPRWMAYVSDESGQQQVYVRPIPPSGDQWLISTAGGAQPRWRRDGRELFYVADDQKLMAVPIKTGGSPSGAPSGPFEAGVPRALFEISIPSQGVVPLFFYQPTADGQRFLVTAPAAGEEAPRITVVLNWAAGRKP